MYVYKRDKNYTKCTNKCLFVWLNFACIFTYNEQANNKIDQIKK